jgi:hypothetical protein
MLLPETSKKPHTIPSAGLFAALAVTVGFAARLLTGIPPTAAAQLVGEFCVSQSLSLIDTRA